MSLKCSFVFSFFHRVYGRLDTRDRPGFEDMSSSSGSQSGEDIDSADQDGEDEIEDEKGAMEKDEKGEKDGELDKESTISPAAPSGEKTTNSEQDQDTRGMKRTRDDNDDSPQLVLAIPSLPLLF